MLNVFDHTPRSPFSILIFVVTVAVTIVIITIVVADFIFSFVGTISVFTFTVVGTAIVKSTLPFISAFVLAFPNILLSRFVLRRSKCDEELPKKKDKPKARRSIN